MKEIGVYQIYCKAMQEDGTGDLYAKYEELKKKLAKEGLFDTSHKRKIPLMPKAIGVLTSSTGSVIKDIINVSTRRNPNVNIKLYPIPVQGEKAELKIAEGIELMNKLKQVDVIILARGGGSIEDLWPFNEEITARAIYDSEIPIISAVGHETDFTIADFVADLRAPTPSAAAELAQVDVREVKYKIDAYQKRMKNSLIKNLDLMKMRYKKAITSRVFTKPLQRVQEEYLKIDISVKALQNAIGLKLKDTKSNLAKNISKLDALSPLKTLSRGYCISEKEGNVIRSVKDLNKGDNIDLKFMDGVKKTIMYLIAIALVIILGIAVAKNMLKENEVEPKNIVDVNKEKEVNILDEEIKQEEQEPEQLENPEETENEPVEEISDEEKAKNIVSADWGEDTSIYFSSEKIEEGIYDIYVREKATTKSLYRYTVDVNKGTFTKEWEAY